MPYDFAKHKTVDSLDTVPADFQPFYKENEEGSFEIDNENPVISKAVGVITGLNKALAKSRKEAKEAGGNAIDLSLLADYGENVEDILESFQGKLDTATKGKGKAAAEDAERQLKKAREDWDKGTQADKAVAEKRIAGLLTQLNKHLVSDRLTQAMVAEGVDDPDLMMPHIMPSVQAVEEDGKFIVRVVDDSADRDVRHGSGGEEMTLSERVQEMKGEPKYARFFKSEAPQGGGTQPGSTTRKPAPAAGKEKSPTDKIQAGLDSGVGFDSGRAAGRK